MFSVVCVCHSVCPREGGPHMTIIHNALDLTVQVPLALPPGHQTWVCQLCVYVILSVLGGVPM